MAHRTVIKIHSILSRSIIRPANSSFRNGSTATRFALNQHNANAYIESLKARPTPLEEAVGCTTSKRLASTAATQYYEPPDGARSYGTSADKKKKKDKCDADDRCPDIALKDCEKTKHYNCHSMEYQFKSCKKRLAPYPSFSEACYEELPDLPNECKCPWPPHAHPTFRQQKKKFHTSATSRLLAPIRDGEMLDRGKSTEGASFKKDNDSMAAFDEFKMDSNQRAAYAQLNETLFGNADDGNARTARKEAAPIVTLSNPNNDLATEFMQSLLHIHKKGVASENEGVPQKESLELAAKKGGKQQKKEGECLKMGKDGRLYRKGGEKCRKLPFKDKEYDIKEKKRKADREKAKQKKSGGSCSDQACSGVTADPYVLPAPPSSSNCEKVMQMASHRKFKEPVEEIRHHVREYSVARKQKLIRELLEHNSMNLKAPTKKPMKPFEFKKLPKGQSTPLSTFITEDLEREEVEAAAAAEAEVMERNEDTIEKIILAKDRIRISGPQICHKPETCGLMKKNKCKTKKKRAQICPKEDLLDHRTYKKFRDPLKGRLSQQHQKKEKARRKAKKQRNKQQKKKSKKGGKKHKKPKKTAAASHGDLMAASWSLIETEEAGNAKSGFFNEVDEKKQKQNEATEANKMSFAYATSKAGPSTRNNYTTNTA